MNSIKIFRDKFGKISGWASHAENGEEMSTDNPEYLEFVKNSENPAPTWEQIRSQRDSLLKDSDWSVAGDANPKPSKEAWLTYRQALRDLPQNFSEPAEVVWPEKPE